MNSSIEKLDDSKVKVTIEVSEDQIEDAIDDAFKKIAQEVKNAWISERQSSP